MLISPPFGRWNKSFLGWNFWLFFEIGNKFFRGRWPEKFVDHRIFWWKNHFFLIFFSNMDVRLFGCLGPWLLSIFWASNIVEFWFLCYLDVEVLLLWVGDLTFSIFRDSKTLCFWFVGVFGHRIIDFLRLRLRIYIYLGNETANFQFFGFRDTSFCFVFLDN